MVQKTDVHKAKQAQYTFAAENEGGYDQVRNWHPAVNPRRHSGLTPPAHKSQCHWHSHAILMSSAPGSESIPKVKGLLSYWMQTTLLEWLNVHSEPVLTMTFD